jgi:hypothetical protein
MFDYDTKEKEHQNTRGNLINRTNQPRVSMLFLLLNETMVENNKIISGKNLSKTSFNF